jgi:hypothetical protein
VKDSSLSRSSVVNRSAPSRLAGRIEKAPSGRIGLGEHLADDQRAERRHRCGLHHERTADRDRRGDLVRGEVERKVERR